MSKFLIGIDPGKDTGFAVYDTDEKAFVLCKKYSFWEAIEKLAYYKTFGFLAYVELPKTKHVWHSGAKNQNAKNRTAVNVGSVIREAELIVEWLEREEVEHKTVAPKGKVNDAVFRKLTGWPGRTSQHARDAGMLLVGVI